MQRTGHGCIGQVLDGRVIERSDGAAHRARGDEKRGFLD
jgi:hypothetical protein